MRLVGIYRSNFVCHFNAVHHRHFDIRYDNIRGEFLDAFHAVYAILGIVYRAIGEFLGPDVAQLEPYASLLATILLSLLSNTSRTLLARSNNENGF